MALRLRNSRAADEHGFTLVELLVVMLIIALLASIALPAFLNQQTKAQDSEAKTAVRNARVTLETFHTDKSTYDATVAELIDIEPALVNARNLQTTGADTTFTISVDSKAGGGGGTYSIELTPAGTVLRDCTSPGKGGCRAVADASGDRW